MGTGGVLKSTYCIVSGALTDTVGCSGFSQSVYENAQTIFHAPYVNGYTINSIPHLFLEEGQGFAGTDMLSPEELKASPGSASFRAAEIVNTYDPIIAIYGLYTDQGVPVTDWKSLQDFIEGDTSKFKSVAYSNRYDWSNNLTMITQSGTVYDTYNAGDGVSGVHNLITGRGGTAVNTFNFVNGTSR